MINKSFLYSPSPSCGGLNLLPTIVCFREENIIFLENLSKNSQTQQSESDRPTNTDRLLAMDDWLAAICSERQADRREVQLTRL